MKKSLIFVLGLLMFSGFILAVPEIANIDYSAFPKDPGDNYDNLVTGKKYYVSPTGTNNNPGTLLLPFKTINYAITQASSGDGIFVRGGTYLVSVYDDRILMTKNGLILNNYNGEKVLIKSANGERHGMEVSGDNIIIDGLSFEGFDSAIQFGRETTQKNLILKNIKLTNCGEGFAGAYTSHPEKDIILKGALFQNLSYSNPKLGGYVIGLHCGGPACQDLRINSVNLDLTGSVGGGSGADALAMERGNNILIENSIVQGASADGYDLKATKVAIVNSVAKHITRNGFKFWHGGEMINCISTDTGADSAIVFQDSGNYRIINSVIAYHNYNGLTSYTGTVGYGVNGQNINLEILNSVFYSNVGSFWVNSDANLTIKNTIFSGGTQTGRYFDYIKQYGGSMGESITNLDSSLIETNTPLFVSPLNDNFHLMNQSLAVDRGINTKIMMDLEGNTRPQGKAYDIGAYELTGINSFPPSNQTVPNNGTNNSVINNSNTTPTNLTTSNSPPQLSILNLTPSKPKEIDNLTLSVKYTDTEGKNGELRFYWKIDGVQVKGEIKKNISSGSIVESKLDYRYLDYLDEVQVLITATDGNTTIRKNSDLVIIGSSSNLSLLDRTKLTIIISLLEEVLEKLKALAQ